VTLLLWARFVLLAALVAVVAGLVASLVASLVVADAAPHRSAGAKASR